MHSRIAYRCLVNCFLILAWACTSSEGNAAWKAGDEFEVLLRVTERPNRLPGLPAPMTDSLRARLVVDSIRGDSVFGRYTARFDSLGIQIGDPGGIPATFVGVVGATSMELVLAPNVVDAELVMSAVGRDQDLTGTWHKRSPLPTRGTFALRKVSPP